MKHSFVSMFDRPGDPFAGLKVNLRRSTSLPPISHDVHPSVRNCDLDLVFTAAGGSPAFSATSESPA